MSEWGMTWVTAGWMTVLAGGFVAVFVAREWYSRGHIRGYDAGVMDTLENLGVLSDLENENPELQELLVSRLAEARSLEWVRLETPEQIREYLRDL